ncbi:hypothetical protein M9M37_001839 [Escherichia coli]|nr:hypothetical protein [Escherichia coli]GDF32083.1 hypothetical protein HmCmsJML270_00766 [Escherichia coli]HAL6342327.1 hypothetical protein [Escherichia coli]HAX4872302.1 hypothetical protein [Escherichia coli]HDQ3585976.1 hypothetical protein [Escherichia coli]
MNVLEIDAILRGHAIPRDMKVNESTAQYFARKFRDLEAIRNAAEKLVRCKGRYHSEQNYRALAELFGVAIPNYPPVADENAWSHNEQN